MFLCLQSVLHLYTSLMDNCFFILIWPLTKTLAYHILAYSTSLFVFLQSVYTRQQEFDHTMHLDYILGER